MESQPQATTWEVAPLAARTYCRPSIPHTDVAKHPASRATSRNILSYNWRDTLGGARRISLRLALCSVQVQQGGLCVPPFAVASPRFSSFALPRDASCPA